MTVVLALQGCSVSTRSIDVVAPTPIIYNIDSALREKCKLPLHLPDRGLTQAEVERYWGTDRKNLIICAERHGLLDAAVRFRDAQLQQRAATR